MTTSLLYQTIDQLSREKNIDSQIIISAVEDAILVAARKYYKTSEDLQSHFNKETGQVEVHAVKKVVEDVQDPDHEINLKDARKYDPEVAVEGEVRIPKPTDVLGRIAAQAAKQVIFQKVREAERDTVYAEYNQRVGELVNCTVKRMEGPDVIVDLGRTEARMPRKEQSRLETYQIGDRIRGVIKEVDRAARGPQVIVSRADGLVVQKLFAMEVPEIYDGTVVIKAIAREAGERTKVAVYSKDPDVDCVGACVGMKGMRVQSIIRELRGEKIDIIEYHEDPLVFAANALSPAKINHVSALDMEDKHLEVIVDDSQLSLAIGKKGQNVRLAAKLLAWHIDIKSEEEKRQEIESQMAAMALRGAPISELKGLGDKTLHKAARPRHRDRRAIGSNDSRRPDADSGRLGRKPWIESVAWSRITSSATSPQRPRLLRKRKLRRTFRSPRELRPPKAAEPPATEEAAAGPSAEVSAPEETIGIEETTEPEAAAESVVGPRGTLR